MRYHLVDTLTGQIIRELNQLPRPRVLKAKRTRLDPLDLKILAAAGLLGVIALSLPH